MSINTVKDTKKTKVGLQRIKKNNIAVLITKNKSNQHQNIAEYNAKFKQNRCKVLGERDVEEVCRNKIIIVTQVLSLKSVNTK